MHKNIFVILDFFEKENVEISISQNANPKMAKSQMPVLEARRPSPSLGLVKLSSTVKFNNKICN